MATLIVGEVIGSPAGNFRVLVERSTPDRADLIGRTVNCRQESVYSDASAPKPRIHEHVTALADWIASDNYFLIQQLHIEVSTEPKTVRNQLFAIAAIKKWPKNVVPMLLRRFDDDNVTDIANWLSVKTYEFKTDNGQAELAAYFDGILNTKQLNQLINFWRYSYLDRQLQLFGLTGREIRAATRHREHEKVLARLKTNPYTVLEIPLDRADAIVRDFPWYYKTVLQRRPGEIARYLVEQLKDHHHTYLPLSWLSRAFPDLNTGQILDELCDPASYDCHLVGSGTDRKLYSAISYRTEQLITTTLAKLLTKSYNVPEKVLSPKGLFPEQWQAVQMALSKGFSIITGGAGTGKTTLVGELGRQVEQRGKSYMIVSYTGKAVRVLRKRTGLDRIMTIHSLVFKPDICEEIETLIIDEASMCPTSLLAQLFSKLPVLSHLMFVGDPEQLPPISWARLLQPLLGAVDGDGNPVVPRYTLRENHRTTNDKGLNTIVTAANEIVRDESLNYRLIPSGNLFWYTGGVAEITTLLQTLTAHGKYNGWQCTVIVPYRKLVVELNQICQDLFNGANTVQVMDKGTLWRVGDRVMLLKNINKLDIMNGEEAQVVGIREDGIMVKFDESEHLFKFNDEAEAYQDAIIEDDDDIGPASTPTTKLLQHSWCLTCHKAQGSEWPVVISYIPWASNFITRNLVYVMMTRAMEWLFLFGPDHVVTQSINNLPPPGYCSLAETLVEKVEELAGDSDDQDFDQSLDQGRDSGRSQELGEESEPSGALIRPSGLVEPD